VTGLRARLRTTLGGFALDAALEAPPSGVTGLFGPSGSGKTSLLRCLAGLTQAERGYVQLDEETWQDADAEVFVPPHRRGVGYVAQHGDLFPQLNVRDNLRYGMRRVPPAERRLSWDDVVEWVAVRPLLDRDVSRLSGGERQRVALGRALLASPRLMLLDEPVSALDEPSRHEVLACLSGVFRRLDVPVLYVSHSLTEVARMAEHLVWLMEGRVADAGSVGQVLGRMDFARWRGEEIATLLDARIRSHDEEYHLTDVTTPLGALVIHRRSEGPGTAIRVQINARDVSIGLEPQHRSSILNELPLDIVEIADLSASDCLVRLARGADSPVLFARLTRRSRDQLALTPGQRVFARVKSVAVLE
jgi:molybdate transport system ATP-binding protein